jgi:DNA ligase-1
MLAAELKDERLLRYPLLATPKVDGIRFLVVNGKAVTRSLNPIPNDHVRTWIEANLYEGTDGEITVPGGFGATSSAVTRKDGTPDFTLHVFDRYRPEPYVQRIAGLVGLHHHANRVRVLAPVEIKDEAELWAFEDRCLADGHEGIILRDPAGRYVCGRTKEEDGLFLKLKRHADDEAIVLTVFPMDGSDTEAGGLAVEWKGVRFNIAWNSSLGLSRADVWAMHESLRGRIVRFRHQPNGAKRLPRFPVLTGFREGWDL